MTIDVSALKQFQATFGPVLAAIPAVLDAVAVQADLDRATAAKRAELSALQDKIDEELALRDTRIANANAQVEQAQAKLAETKALAQSAAAEAQRLVEDRKAKLTEDLKGLEGDRAKLAKEISGLQAQYNAERADLEASHKKRKDALEAEIADLVVRKEEAASALEVIRVKLG